MISSEKIEFAGNWSNTVLACPRCGGGDIHQERVTVFDRPEDASKVLVTVCEAGRATATSADNDSSGNPSARRQGLAIKFSCERCSDERNADDLIELTIAQHKGATFLKWRYTERIR